MRPEYMTRRSADVFRIAHGPQVGQWRINIRLGPDDTVGWVGGRIAWGHDKLTQIEAQAVADAWINDNVLPEGMDRNGAP